jgi:hypothetical protein
LVTHSRIKAPQMAGNPFGDPEALKQEAEKIAAKYFNKGLKEGRTMIELRWVRFTATRRNSLGDSYDYKEKKLQYRQSLNYPDTVIAGDWTPWQEVPTVELEEPITPLQARCR